MARADDDSAGGLSQDSQPSRAARELAHQHIADAIHAGRLGQGYIENMVVLPADRGRATGRGVALALGGVHAGAEMNRMAWAAAHCLLLLMT